LLQLKKNFNKFEKEKKLQQRWRHEQVVSMYQHEKETRPSYRPELTWYTHLSSEPEDKDFALLLNGNEERNGEVSSTTTGSCRNVGGAPVNGGGGLVEQPSDHQQVPAAPIAVPAPSPCITQAHLPPNYSLAQQQAQHQQDVYLGGGGYHSTSDAYADSPLVYTPPDVYYSNASAVAPSALGYMPEGGCLGRPYSSSSCSSGEDPPSCSYAPHHSNTPPTYTSVIVDSQHYVNEFVH
ncbi:unnamed protein product, partial [Nesidiocoris tenuis]